MRGLPNARASRDRRRQDGFTLVEVLIALLVLTVGVLGTARLIGSSDARTLDSELQQVATEKAEQSIEDVRALDYDEIGHSATDLPNSGTPWQSPDANLAEDIVTAASGAGVASTRTFSVPRGGDKPPVTGTIKTYVTWRDEECSLVSLTDLPAVTRLATRLSALQAQLAPLVGTTGLLNTTVTSLTDRLISAIPSGQRPAYVSLRSELNAIIPLLNTTSTEVLRVQGLLNGLNGLEIDLCDLEPADLAGLQALLSVDSSLVATLTTKLGPVQTTLTSLSGPLNTLAGYVAGTLGTLTCGLLPTPNICGTVSSQVGPALNALAPSSGTKPSTVAGQVNTLLTGLDIDLDGLEKDTTHNTKRITVGVTLDTPGNTTPKNTVWASSVVTDPDAGLLFSDGL